MSTEQKHKFYKSTGEVRNLAENDQRTLTTNKEQVSNS